MLDEDPRFTALERACRACGQPTCECEPDNVLLLEQAIAIGHDAARAHECARFALGLIREGDHAFAARYLREASDLDPATWRRVYYAIAFPGELPPGLP